MTEPLGRPSVARAGSGRRERGVTLIESLIALLVLGIALLGVASLQLTTMHEEMQARWRSEAVALSSAIFEQLRIDRNASAGITIDGSSATGCSESNAWLCQSLNTSLESAARVLPNLTTSLSVADSEDRSAVSLEIGWVRTPDEEAVLDCQASVSQGAALAGEGVGCIWLETLL